ncbi:hypothetical protein J1605_002547 [Eschrichtius robustus]|uniref:Uncharacterized protein n=1 Tax=Eschrichtius robustus TaxID=9764 RepID=A0AB34HYD8_ESCRO|nr:hypothetical protein J1605_002547 [Eschrichtius robustus]
MLQALYFCRLFWENALAYKVQEKNKENLLTCLADLFYSTTTQKKKRFKHMKQLFRYTKLSYRVVFLLEARLFNTSHEAVNLDHMYDLVAVVVHYGGGSLRQWS